MTHRRKRATTRIRQFGARLVLVVEAVAGHLLMLLGFLASVFGMKAFLGHRDYIVPAPRILWAFMRDSGGVVLVESLQTYGLAIISLGAGAALAFITAKGVAANMRLTRLGVAWALAWQTFPVVALAPLYYLFFNNGFVSAVLVAVTISYFPLFLCILGAFSTPVPDVERFFDQTGRWPPGGCARVRLNCAYPALESAVLGSAALALVGAVVAEFLFFNNGIGYQIRIARNSSIHVQLIGCIVVMTFVNMFYFPVVKWTFKRVFWGADMGRVM